MTEPLRLYPRPDSPAIGLFAALHRVPLDSDIRAFGGDEWESVPFDRTLWERLDLASFAPSIATTDELSIPETELDAFVAHLATKRADLPQDFTTALEALVGLARQGALLDVALWRDAP